MDRCASNGLRVKWSCSTRFFYGGLSWISFGTLVSVIYVAFLPPLIWVERCLVFMLRDGATYNDILCCLRLPKLLLNSILPAHLLTSYRTYQVLFYYFHYWKLFLLFWIDRSVCPDTEFLTGHLFTYKTRYRI